MPRAARKQSETGIYHIIVRGVDKQQIFMDDEDRERLLQILAKYKGLCGFSLFAYCLMSNHIHLLIQTGKEPIGQIMKRIGVSYVKWFNDKHQRCGHLFQDRFRSEPVEDDAYFLTALRYILQNPVKAKLTEKIEDYKWSSCRAYLKGGVGLTDTDYATQVFNNAPGKTALHQFMQEENDDECLDVEKRSTLSDEQLEEIIEEQYLRKFELVLKNQREQRARLLKELLKIEGVSKRQLVRVSGISRSVLRRMESRKSVPILSDVEE